MRLYRVYFLCLLSTFLFPTFFISATPLRKDKPPFPQLDVPPPPVDDERDVAHYSYTYSDGAAYANWNKPIPISISISIPVSTSISHRVGRRQHRTNAQTYNININRDTPKLSLHPDVHPRGERVHEFSLFVHRAQVTQALSDAVVRCMGYEWFPYNVEEFSTDTTQIEYFTSVPTDIAPVWRYNADKFLRNGILQCANTSLSYARKIQVADADIVADNFIGEQPWVINAFAAAAVVIAAEISALIWLRTRRRKALTNQQHLDR